ELRDEHGVDDREEEARSELAVGGELVVPDRQWSAAGEARAGEEHLVLRRWEPFGPRADGSLARYELRVEVEVVHPRLRLSVGERVQREGDRGLVRGLEVEERLARRRVRRRAAVAGQRERDARGHLAGGEAEAVAGHDLAVAVQRARIDRHRVRRRRVERDVDAEVEVVREDL